MTEYHTGDRVTIHNWVDTFKGNHGTIEVIDDNTYYIKLDRFETGLWFYGEEIKPQQPALDDRYLDDNGRMLTVDEFVERSYGSSFAAKSLVKELRHMGYLKEN